MQRTRRDELAGVGGLAGGIGRRLLNDCGCNGRRSKEQRQRGKVKDGGGGPVEVSFLSTALLDLFGKDCCVSWSSSSSLYRSTVATGAWLFGERWRLHGWEKLSQIIESPPRWRKVFLG